MDKGSFEIACLVLSRFCGLDYVISMAAEAAVVFVVVGGGVEREGS